MSGTASNRGIVLFANGDGSAGARRLVAGGTILSSLVDIGLAARVVFTVKFQFAPGGVTSFTVRVRLTNTNRFVNLVEPAGPNTGSTDPVFTATPILSNDNNLNPGVAVVDHLYPANFAFDGDLIELAGPLAGSVDVLVTPAGAGPFVNPNDRIKISLDVF